MKMKQTKSPTVLNNNQLAKKRSSFADGFLNIANNFADKALNFLRHKFYYILAFALPIIILYITFYAMEMYPYGEKSVLTLDTDGQYIYFFEQLRDVYTGQASLFYTFERCLGGEFLGYFAYYLASPISFLVVFFPSSLIVEALKYIILLKCGLAGLSFAIYLSRTRKKNIYGFIMFPVMYALSSYFVMYQFNPMWMDAFAWLPIIALGIESLAVNGRFKLFIISLSIAVCSNFYIGYMLCIFVAIYFFFVILSKPNDELNGLNESYHRLKSLARIAIASIIALMIASTIIFSAYYSLSFGKTSYQNNEMDAQIRFDFLHLIAKMFMGSFDTLRPEGTPNIYAGLLTLLLLPAFYFSKKVKSKEKIGFSVLIFIFLASFSINTYDLIWHGFQAPVWFNYRYSFMLSFIFLIMAYRAFEELDEISPAFMGKTAVGLFLLIAIVQKTVVLSRYEYVETDWKEIPTTPGLSMIWLSVLFICLYLLMFYIRNKKPILKTLTSVFIVCLVCFEALFNTIIGVDGALKDGGVAYRDGYRDYIDPLSETVEKIKDKDPGFYRMEHLRYRKNNDNLAVDIRGLSESTSTFNKSTVDVMSKFGLDVGSPAIRYVSSNPIIDSIFGIKYIIAPNESHDTNGRLPGLYSIYGGYEKIFTTDHYDVFLNPYTLPVAYYVDKNFSSKYEEKEFFESGLSFSTTSNNMISCMLGKDVNLFTVCEYALDKGNLSKVYDDSNGGMSFRKNDNDSAPARFGFTVQAHTDGNIYMHLPSPYTTSAKLYVDDKLIYSNFFQGNEKGIIDLGYFKEGEIVNIDLEFTHWRLYIWDTKDYFVQMDEAAFKGTFANLNAGGLKIDEYSDTFISGSLRAFEDGCVFTTIPYDSNWQVYVDGERVETFEMIDSMLGFNVGKGEHTIELEYVHTPFITGAIISVFGIALLILLCVFEKKIRERFMKPSPEILEALAKRANADLLNEGESSSDAAPSPKASDEAESQSQTDVKTAVQAASEDDFVIDESYITTDESSTVQLENKTKTKKKDKR